MLVIIETISLFIQPIALAVRLTANITAGHLLIHLIGGATLALTSISPTTALITFIILILLTILEFAVAIIQAYVFTLLVSLYLHMTRWRNSLQPRLIHTLSLPKFSISSDYNLEDTLSELNIQKVFTSEADLSGITGVRNLEVSQVVHSAVLDVDEEGTEGAAATGVQIIPTSSLTTIVRFNRPFLIAAILKDTQSIIFLGKVTNPS